MHAKGYLLACLLLVTNLASSIPTSPNPEQHGVQPYELPSSHDMIIGAREVDTDKALDVAWSKRDDDGNNDEQLQARIVSAREARKPKADSSSPAAAQAQSQRQHASQRQQNEVKGNNPTNRGKNPPTV